jgi:drug/metabolite transporter (DMT)-like permease
VSLPHIALAILTVIGLSAGQIFFKLAAGRLNLPDSWWERIVLNPYLYIALTIYALATATWIGLLSRVPLNVAYPFTALAFFVVPVIGHLFLSEALRWQTLLGAGFILVGVWISNQGS